MSNEKIEKYLVIYQLEEKKITTQLPCFVCKRNNNSKKQRQIKATERVEKIQKNRIYLWRQLPWKEYLTKHTIKQTIKSTCNHPLNGTDEEEDEEEELDKQLLLNISSAEIGK